MSRALVTGAAGFAGRVLVEELADAGHEVVATGRARPDRLREGVAWRTLDVTHAGQCREVLREIAPDWTFHLAAVADVAGSENTPAECLRVNFGGTRTLLEAALEDAPRTRFLFASSAQVYGRVQPDDLPLHERVPLRPASIYAVSKAAAEMSCHHAAARGLDVVVARAYNHVGPRLPDRFVPSAFAHQVARIEAGLEEPVIGVGNLEPRRDFCDVRDVARAYRHLAERGERGEVYDVSSGEARSIRELLDALLARCEVEVEVRTDPARVRPLDMPVFHGSGDKLAEATGFRLGTPFERSLGDLLAYWREAVRKAPSPRR